ncbi:LPXTG cell wall anchor domain-containing protein [Roseburia hominis]
MRTFEHASDYVAVIDEKSNTSNENNVPKTGDLASVTLYVSLLAFAAVVLVVLLRKKVNNRI